MKKNPVTEKRRAKLPILDSSQLEKVGGATDGPKLALELIKPFIMPDPRR